MKRLIYTYLLCSLTTVVLVGQQVFSERISLQWNSSPVDIGMYEENEVNLMTFEGASIDGDNPELPRYLHHLDVVSDGVLEVKVVPLKVSPVLGLSTYATEQILNEYKVQSTIVHARDRYQAHISITPIVRSLEGFSKLEDFVLEVIFTPKYEASFRDPNMKTTSVLSTGTWHKMAIPADGVYSINGSFLEDELGIDISNLSSGSLQLYGNIGGPLPEENSADQPDDLLEIPLLMADGNDGSFGASDFFLFYAEGADKWHFDKESLAYSHEQNPYDHDNYVFLRTDGSNGKRVTSVSSNGTADYVSDEFDFVQIYDDERTNLLGQYASTEGTGKEWYGDYFGIENSQRFQNKFDISDLSALGEANIVMRFAARGENTTQVMLTVNGQEFSKSVSGTSLSDIEREYARATTIKESVNLDASSNIIQIDYTKSIPQDEGWLDYILLEYRKKISAKYPQMRVSDKRSIGYDRSAIAVPAGITVWDVTDMHRTAIITPASGQVIYESTEDLRTFYYVQSSSYLTPKAIGPVINQNIHAIERADLVIAYHPDFADATQKLATHRRTHSGLVVETVNILDVYNEFSSGRLDPTALRDFSRMIAERDQNFRYLLLMGDGSYDYRSITPNIPNHNFIPAYETDESLDPIQGFPSDDFYALLSDNEGNNGLRGALDIAVGRLPVTTAALADGIVSKIIRYDTNKNAFGDWRLKVAFAADDEDGNTHVNQADDIAENVEETNPIYNQSKIYYDAYVQESTPGGERYPGATQAINTAVQNGTLLLNYLGHGGPKGWAQERVLKVSDIESWENQDAYPVLVTATCSFTGYDDPSIVSAGEVAIQKRDGGVVALLTTVRAVYASDNKRLATAVFDEIFNKVDGKPQTLGEIITIAKNENADASNAANDRKFSLIGDPSQRIAIPTYNVMTTSINGLSAGEIDTISALEKVTIKGVITGQNGQILTDFNGTVNPTVYDKESTLETLANDSRSSVRSFGVYRNILFKGLATVTNGAFEFSFVMPKDINYEFGKGRISYYAYDGEVRDAAGNYNEIIVGGTDPNALADDIGPEMQLYMNHTNFVSGGNTNADPVLLVNLSDDLGINVSGTSIGHDITAILDGNRTTPYILNEFYQASVDDYTRGAVNFPLSDLALGPHSMVVKAWDVSNNSTESQIDFTVVEGDGRSVNNVYNYPNPFMDGTTFSFEHDLVGSDLQVSVHIYNLTGQLIRTISQEVISSKYRVDNISWNVEEEYGSGLPAGVYLYQVLISDLDSDEIRESDFYKMLILE